MIEVDLKITKRTDSRLLSRMENHYSKPKGFIGRNICYAIYVGDTYYGHIVGGSATKHLPNRERFFNSYNLNLNCIINNLFYNVSKVGDKYPCRNFTSKVMQTFLNKVKVDWYTKYSDVAIGVETLVEKPRTGELYLKSGFTLIGETKGYTCKRIAGKGTDNWTGKRIWNTDKDSLRPKLVFAYRYPDAN